MNKYQRESIENRINDIWWMVDHGVNEEKETRYVERLNGISMALEAIGYVVRYNSETKKREIMSFEKALKEC